MERGGGAAEINVNNQTYDGTFVNDDKQSICQNVTAKRCINSDRVKMEHDEKEKEMEIEMEMEIDIEKITRNHEQIFAKVFSKMF